MHNLKFDITRLIDEARDLALNQTNKILYFDA